MRITFNAAARALAAAAVLVASSPAAGRPQQQPAQGQGAPAAQAPAAQPAIEEWRDDFDGDRLDETKWEQYAFVGGGGKATVKDKVLRLRGAGESRSGVRSRQTFRAERFYVEATLAKVSGRTPNPGEQSFPVGFAILTVLFDGDPANRLEWILTSDGNLEAHVSADGRMERVDNRKLAFREKLPRLGIARRGETVFFMVNGKVGLEHTVRGLSQNFKVMLYGFGSTENNWDSVSVQTLKQ